MTNHRKRRIRDLADKLGVSHRTAANIITKRANCQRGGHVANRTPQGPTCTDCGAALHKCDEPKKEHGT
jgi:hypothetical protein